MSFWKTCEFLEHSPMGPEFRKLQSDHDILYKGRHQAIQWKKIGINNNFNINRKYQLRNRQFWTIGTSVRRSSRSAFGRSTGNDVSGHYKRHYFLFSFLFFSFLCRLLCSDQKTYFAKVDGSAQNSRNKQLSRPPSHFEAPWCPFWGFEVLIEGMI